MMMYGNGFWGMGIGMIFNLLILIGCLYFIFYLIKRISHPDQKSRSEINNGLKIAQERYARGELTEEEFMKMKNVLTQSNKQ